MKWKYNVEKQWVYVMKHEIISKIMFVLKKLQF